MPDLIAWASYGLSDFLLFSPRAYWRMFELHNAALWPLPLLTLVAGFAAAALALWRPRHHTRWIALILAVLWAWIAWSFFWQRYAAINWAAAYVAPIFAVQAALLLAIGVSRARWTCDLRGARGVAGLVLISVAVVLYPLLAPAFGRPWTGAEIFGIAPDPTSIGTLGFLLLMRGGWSIALLAIPIVWCIASGLTLWGLSASLSNG